MTEFVVDSVSSGAAKGHYIGDSPHPTKEPETHYFKKPMEERLARRTGQRAAEGWRLVSTSASEREGGHMVFLFFERETRASSVSERTQLDEPQQIPASPSEVGAGGGTEPVLAPSAAQPSAPTGGFSERLRPVLRGLEKQSWWSVQILGGIAAVVIAAVVIFALLSLLA